MKEDGDVFGEILIAYLGNLEDCLGGESIDMISAGTLDAGAQSPRITKKLTVDLLKTMFSTRFREKYTRYCSDRQSMDEVC